MIFIILYLSILISNYCSPTLFDKEPKEGENLTPYKLQILSSALVTIAGIITLYVILSSEKETVADVENPIV